MAKKGNLIWVRPDGAGEGAWEKFTPHSMTWSLQDVSKPSSGRDLNGKMHKERLEGKNGQKVKLELSWSGVDRMEASRILKAFNPEYIEVHYPDAMDVPSPPAGTLPEDWDDRITKTFYVGDRTAPVWMYTNHNKIYETVSFNIIEV